MGELAWKRCDVRSGRRSAGGVRWTPSRPGAWAHPLDVIAALSAAIVLIATFAHVWMSAAVPPAGANAEAGARGLDRSGSAVPGANETLLAGYIGAPFYYRSDVHLMRPGRTDATFKRLGWDGDALHFPIDGGIRAVRWGASMGYMVDFLHNKAVARLGKGAHGRKLSNPVVEEVAVQGTLEGQPAPARVKLTDVFERLEFTHGHNMLFLTPMVRLWSLAPGVRPYFGVGAGLALPHVEVWFPGEKLEERTNEYQYAGPAWQLVAGLEFRSGRGSYFVEYKFSYAWIAAALTGDESWKNFNMPGDVLRQVMRWWSGAPPKHGRISTTLAAHQIVVGGGYWWQRGAAASP